MGQRGKGRRAAIVGGGVVGLGILAAFLLDLFPSLEGPGDGGAQEEDVAASVNPTQTKTVKEPDDVDKGQLQVVDVLIDDRTYLLRSTKGDAAPVETELDEIVKLAQQAPGNDDGIRVRIARRENARFTAQQALKEKLAAAGLSSDAVFLIEEYVP